MSKVKKIAYLLVALFVIAAVMKSFGLKSASRITARKDVLVLNERLEKVTGTDQDGAYGGYRCILPEDCGTDQLLGMEGYTESVQVFLDGEQIYAYEDPYMEKGSIYHWIELPGDISGRELLIRFPEEMDSKGMIFKGNIYLGSPNGVFLEVLQQNGTVLIFSMVFLAVGVTLLMVIWFCRKKLSRRIYYAMMSLGIFICLAACWILTDSSFLQFFTRKTSVITLCSFMTFMVMPVFLLKFVREIYFDAEKMIDVLCGLYWVNLAFSLVCYLLRLLPLYQTLIVTHILIVVSIVLIVIEGVREIRQSGNREIKRIVLSFAILAVFALAALVGFWTSVVSDYASIYCVGIFLFIFVLADAALGRLKYQIGQRASMEAYQKLAYMDVMTGLENRTAFIEEQEPQKMILALSYIVLDINNLKLINDTWGHQEGDRLIVDVAECIRDTFGQIGRCYRIGGDEFVVALKNVSFQEMERSLKKFESRVAEMNDKRRIQMHIAYGYAMQKNPPVSNEALFAEADSKMYRKKKIMKEKQ